MAYRGSQLDLEDLQSSMHYSGWRAYQRSKLANILFTLELARRLDDRRGARSLPVYCRLHLLGFLTLFVLRQPVPLGRRSATSTRVRLGHPCFELHAGIARRSCGTVRPYSAEYHDSPKLPALSKTSALNGPLMLD